MVEERKQMRKDDLRR